MESNMRKYQNFNTEGKKWKVVNFSHNKLSKVALDQLGLKEKDVVEMPAELKKGMDAEEYVHSLVSKLEWSNSYLVVAPGLVLLAFLTARALAELQMPVQLINLMRSRDENVFYIADIY